MKENDKTGRYTDKNSYSGRREGGDKPSPKRRAHGKEASEGSANREDKPFRRRKEGMDSAKKPYAGPSVEAKGFYGGRSRRNERSYQNRHDGERTSCPERKCANGETRQFGKEYRPRKERQPDIELAIDRLDDRFCGVAYIGADRYTVEGGLPKEKVRVRVNKTEFGVRYADIVSILEPSPFRVEPVCPYYRNCGGCALLHLCYDEELKQKTALVKKKLLPFHFYNVDDCVRSSENGFASRNKAHIAFEYKGKDLCVGFFDENTHHVMDVPYCPMHGDWYARLVKILRDWVTRFDIQVYEPKNNKGHLRFAAARWLRGCLMLTIVTASPKIASLQELYNMLRVSFPRLSFWKNLNNELANEVMAGQMTHIAGDKKLIGEMMDLKFQLSPESFFQVNEKIAEIIYRKVFDVLHAAGIKNVVDLYSGIGITSALLAKAGFNVTSIEIEEGAVRDAKILCEQNGITGVRHLCGDVREMLPSVSGTEGKLAFFVDPPRAGLGEEVCRTIAEFAPAMLLYLSCSPSTLATDLETLLPAGYAIMSVTPYDMFPHSRHIETLVCMTRK
jgi:23S rRNA (uracil1939-C5)-methyltransferase